MNTTPVTKLRNALGGREWEPALVGSNGHGNGHVAETSPVHELNSELPHEVALAYDEALRAAKEEIWNASVLMGRRALAEAMKHIEAEGSSLQQQIASAVEKGLLVRTLQEWAQSDRMSENLRSDGPSEQKWMEAADAREILELCDWTFKYLYVLPAQIDERRKQLVGAWHEPAGGEADGVCDGGQAGRPA